MTHGFDFSSPLVCEGIVGDGCGGGRIFYINGNFLNVYDPTTRESLILYDKLKDVKSLTKKGCILFIESVNEDIEFDISTLNI